MKTIAANVIILMLFAIAPEARSQTVSTLVPGPSSFDDCLTLDASGNIFASRYVGSAITKITRAGATQVFASGFSQPNGTAFDNNGNLYVPSNVSAGWIAKVSPSGVVDTLLAGIPYPTAILFDGDTSMFITSYQTNRIYKANLSGNFSILYSGNGMNGPVGMAYDNNHDLLVANYTDGKIFRVSSSGVFSLITDLPSIVGFIAFANHSIYATGFSSNKIYRIKPNGETSVLAGTGAAGQVNGAAANATFNAPNGIAVTPSGDTIYISDFNARSLRVITDVRVGIELLNHGIPSSFELRQNYPNPFNPSTNIEFAVPTGGHVLLKIYNALGVEVITLINENLRAGSYKRRFNASNLPSGTYFAVLSHNGKTLTRKVTLLK